MNRVVNHETVVKDDLTFGSILDARGELFQKYKQQIAPASFKDIFGDLSDCVFESDLPLSGLNLSSLEGCPTEIKYGSFDISNNQKLRNLNYFPKKLDKLYVLSLGQEQINAISAVPPEQYLNISTINLVVDNVLYEETVMAFSIFKRLNGAFPVLRRIRSSAGPIFVENSPIDQERLEKLYLIYKKTDFNPVKFKRALSLIS